MNYDCTYVTIDLDALAANIDTVAQKAGVPVMAVVKADAYGHGAVPVARLLEDRCAFFGVSSLAEALELRRAGIRKPILILGYLPPEGFARALAEGIRPTLFRYEDAEALSREALRLTLTDAPFHLAVDTGMGRIGFAADDSGVEECVKIAALPGLAAEGIFSHFATADCAELEAARAQAARFDRFCDALEQRGVRIPVRHMNNSAGIMNFERQYDLVRSGIVTYGQYPSREVDPADLPLKAVLRWDSTVSHLKWLPEGSPISYGGAYVTQAPTRVATVPVGYADGYRRSLSGKFYVLIRGQRAPILGRICMDQMMVDVTAIEGVAPGDRVTLVGSDGSEEIRLEDIAEAAGSFNYEFVCGISRRVPRRYLLGGRQTQTVHYLLDS